jgi:chemotaxis protein methyltransferase CheR
MTRKDSGHSETMARLVREHAGLSFRPEQAGILVTAARSAMADTGASTLEDFVDRLPRDRDALYALVDHLSIGETYFFRVPEQFDLIARKVVPAIRNDRGSGHVIRMWSAGCASGEEPYSLAILFDEMGLLPQTRILATDISRRSLVTARRGLFRPWALRDQGKRALSRLREEEGAFRLDDVIREHVVFEYLNLAFDAYPSMANGTWGQDLILCRNVLIYFAPETIEAVANRLFQSLAEGGWLMLGPSDPIVSGMAPFKTQTTDAGVIYRRVAAGAESFSIGYAPDESGSQQGAHAPPSAIGLEEAPDVADGNERTADGESATPAASDSPGAPSGGISALAMAREAFAAGDYRTVITLMPEVKAGEDTAALLARALANVGDQAAAERAAQRGLLLYPMSRELRYLYAVLLMERGREEEALQNIRKLLYVDSSLAAGHFILALILQRMGDIAGSRRAYGRVRRLAGALPPEAIVPLSDGERAGRLLEAADVQLALLESVSPEEGA